MATWEAFTYDDPVRSYRRAERWIPTGAGKPAIIYCPGNDWAARSPGMFYDPTAGEPFFLDQIEPQEATSPVAVFSMLSASAAYDSVQVQPAWVTSTAYAAGDLVSSVGEVFRCTKAHSSGAATEPGVGADFDHRWYQCHEQEITDHLSLEQRHRTPAFRASGVLDCAALFAHIIENASVYGIDPGLVFVMGRGAGAQQAGAFAYDLGDGYSTLDRPALGAPYIGTNKPKPAGAILIAGPDDFKWHPWGAILENLFGRDLSATWATMPDARKSALSPLGVLRSTLDSIPTFLAYGGQGFFNPATDVPPYLALDIAHARNGYQLFQQLVGSLAQPDVVFVEDHATLGSTFNVWNSTSGVSGPDHTIPDTDQADELWSWFASLI